MVLLSVLNLTHEISDNRAQRLSLPSEISPRNISSRPTVNATYFKKPESSEEGKLCPPAPWFESRIAEYAITDGQVVSNK